MFFILNPLLIHYTLCESDNSSFDTSGWFLALLKNFIHREKYIIGTLYLMDKHQVFFLYTIFVPSLLKKFISSKICFPISSRNLMPI